MMKKILITGKNSYLGNSLHNYLDENFPGRYEITKISLRDDAWKSMDFGEFDSVYHVAGIAHVEVSSVGGDVEGLYNRVNCELAQEVAAKAAADGAGQLIYLSSILVYGDHKEPRITAETKIAASDVYGHSKVLAEMRLNELDRGNMKLCILRPPMIYGKGCKGNFPMLVKFAKALPFFPATKNRRSMLHVDNLNEFVRLMIENEEEGVFFPQNSEYSDTAKVISAIARAKGKWMPVIGVLGFVSALAKRLPGVPGSMANKAFGDLYYDMEMSVYDKGDYRIYDLEASIEKTVL